MEPVEYIIDSVLEKHAVSKDTFCFAPYFYFDFDQSGEMHTCYKGKTSMGNWKAGKVLTQFNSKNYNDLRLAQKKGDKGYTWPNCEDCYAHEDHKVWSLRKTLLVDKYNELGHAGFENLVKKIKALGTDKVNLPVYDYVEMRLSNFCNLRCLHCDQRSSTQWLNFLTDPEVFEVAEKIAMPIGHDVTSNNLIEKHKHFRENDNIDLDDVIDIISKSRAITLSGGEPLLDPNYFRLMDGVSKQSLDIHRTIDIHTNLNIKNIERYFKHWETFQKVQIFVSIDVPPSTYKYFRRNGDWKLVADNIKKIKTHFPNKKHVNVLGHITFNLFGALGWHELCEEWQAMNLQANSNIVTQGPTCSMYLPDKLKTSTLRTMESIIERSSFDDSLINQTVDCYTYLKNTERFGDILHQDVLEWCKIHDAKTNLQTLDFFPELKIYYNRDTHVK